MTLILNAAGGLGIFLLAMAMMTGGLKVFGGERLRRHLERWTSTPLRGVATGALVTALVQSSSAVTVATIGFVNAGVLSLRHALGVIFGANVGTTMTGWLVSLVGFGFKIEAIALPIIALGVALRVAVENKRLRGLSSVAIFALVGLVATVLTQSSSAAIALILTAASQSALGLGAAAAAIIGANVGTTSTAAFAVIGATPNAKRVAAGHILFNLLTGLVALAILPLLLWVTETLGQMIGFSDQPVIVLALFHTVFNAVGVVLLLPFVGRLSGFLQRHFVTAEEDIGRPRHLDRTVASTPAFAVPALAQELRRLQDLVCSTGLAAVAGQESRASVIERRAAAMVQLGQSIAAFAVEVRMEGMSREHAEALARLLRIARYLDEAAMLLSAVHATNRAGHGVQDEGTRGVVLDLMASAQAGLNLCGQLAGDRERLAGLEAALTAFEESYQQAKAAVLRAAAVHLLSIEQADSLLDAMSGTRRMMEQITKATSMLQNESLAVDHFPRAAAAAQP
jgi:phosphate:Na+ symporter